MDQKIPIHQLLYSTARIKAELPRGISSVGTCFIVEHKFQGVSAPFLVTNKHVVNGARKGQIIFTKANDTNNPLIGDGLEFEVEFKEGVWYPHPGGEDIVITPFLPLVYLIKKVMNQRIYYRSIPLAIVQTKEQEEKLTALEEVIFIGYPNGIYDKANLLPIIRKGISATPICLDYYAKPVFLIDASVFEGSSGSPVFIYNHGSYSDSDGNMIVGSRIYFIGVVTRALSQTKEGKIEFKEIPSYRIPRTSSKQKIDLGVVIKSKVIIETVEAWFEKMKPVFTKKEQDQKNKLEPSVFVS